MDSQEVDFVQETIKTFDKYASQYQDAYMSYAPYVQTYHYLSQLLPADGKILDVACGPGNITHYLLKDKPTRRVLGIDLSEKMLELAKHNNPSAEFKLMDSRHIASLAETYDGIVVGFCFPYLSPEAVNQFINDAKSIMNTGGIIYVSFMESEEKDSGPQSKNNIDWVHIHYHQAQHIVQTLQSAGFEILDTRKQRFDKSGEATATDVFIYARLISG